MAELFVEAFISVLIEKLATGNLFRLARSAQVSSKLGKWRDTLAQIQAVLVDARQRHIKERPVQLWLNRLQLLAYEIDDVLDDLATEATRHQLNQQSYASTSSTISKVLKFVPAKYEALKYGREMSSKLDLIDGITVKLRELIEAKQLLALNVNVERQSRGSERREETSLIGESEIIGREDDKEALLKKLLGGESSSSQKVSVVSVVGMGGIGKTTLARILYNDEKVKACFELREALSEKLSKKKFLLVLDDVWNEKYEDWECLQRPFVGGAHGSKVLVTTRKAGVASVMDSVEAYPLELLSSEEALSLFSHHALGKQNFDVNRILKLHGEDIVKKCGRLPLALKTVGRVFRTKSNEEEWKDLLNSEIWSLGDKDDIPSALRLSYYDLQPQLKQMFMYCCLFLKDHMFNKDDLVLLWMAEGFLYASNAGNKSMESFGRECFEELVSRSLFLHSSNDISLYEMHDLVHDLATSVAGEFFSTVQGDMFVSGHEPLEKLHHFSYLSNDYGTYNKFKALHSAKRMRTFLAMPGASPSLRRGGFYYVSNKVLLELLSEQRFLRVLSLAHYYIRDLSNSIGRLKHLRYLNFSNTMISCLPEQVGDLLNLETLLLHGCNELTSLPNSAGKLVNLRHLDISGTPKLNKMAFGIGGLIGLQTLTKVIVGGADQFKIFELKGLKRLQGRLSIEGLHKVKNVVEAREANLQEKKGIYDLHMVWSDIFDDSRDATTEQKVLEGLRPFEMLKELHILYYAGREFPRWVRDPSLVCLTTLVLRGCKSCTHLPTLGHLPSLQHLYVENMPGLKKVGPGFLGATNACDGVAFPSLKLLSIENMEGWEEWSTSSGVKARAFPQLSKIVIVDCVKLDVVEIEVIPSLRDIYLDRCSLTMFRSMVDVSSSIAKLTVKNIRGLTHIRREDLEHLKAVEHLEVWKCDEVAYLWEQGAEAYEILGSLRVLYVCDCPNLVSLGDKEVHLRSNMKSVREVTIANCPKLESYKCPNSIERLIIRKCCSVSSVSFPTIDNIPFTLKHLSINWCDNVEVSWPLNNNFLSSLEYLKIGGMQNLRRFPQVSLVHLRRLRIDDCDNIEIIPDDGNGFLPFPCLMFLRIMNCKNLKSFPHEHLQSHLSLELMAIRECPSLDGSFPCGLWPPNLSWLRIGGLKKPMSEWGMQNFPTSLGRLGLYGGNSGAVPFAAAKAQQEDTISSSSSFLLPSSLTTLAISDFKGLESVSESMQHLTSLQQLEVLRCPKLRDLPFTLLPSLSALKVEDCPKLRKKCSNRKGKYWSLISHIPHLFGDLDH